MLISRTGAGTLPVGANNSFLEVKQGVKGESVIRLIRVNHSKGWGAKPLV